MMLHALSSPADMVAVRLTLPFEAITLASPSYLEARGKPRSIAELAAHACIGYRLITADTVYAWDLIDNGRQVSVAVDGPVRVTDALYARELALEGIGIAYLFEPLVRDDIRAGRLKRILPEASLTEPGLFLYFPQGASAAPKLRAFIDVAREVLKASPRKERPAP